MLHTIGYEGTTIVEFVAVLNSAGIDLVIDVRDVPISRKAGFSKSALACRLAASEIDYLHLKSLGDPKPGRVAAREGRYDDFRRIFTRHLQNADAQIDLQRGIEAAMGRSACLLCFECDHTHCHRVLVADEMTRRGGFCVVHLDARRGSSQTKVRGRRSAQDKDLVVIG